MVCWVGILFALVHLFIQFLSEEKEGCKGWLFEEISICLLKGY